MWFCSINSDAYYTASTECFTGDIESNEPPMFSCCLAIGGFHVAPQCSKPSHGPVYYNLQVMDWCVSSEGTTHVTVRAPACTEEEESTSILSNQRSCFKLSSTADGKMDFIAAFQPEDKSRPHGYQRRTSAQVDLVAGMLTANESETSDAGLIATHGVFMLIAFMVVAPLGIFVSGTKASLCDEMCTDEFSSSHENDLIILSFLHNNSRLRAT